MGLGLQPAECLLPPSLACGHPSLAFLCGVGLCPCSTLSVLGRSWPGAPRPPEEQADSVGWELTLVGWDEVSLRPGLSVARLPGCVYLLGPRSLPAGTIGGVAAGSVALFLFSRLAPAQQGWMSRRATPAFSPAARVFFSGALGPCAHLSLPKSAVLGADGLFSGKGYP